MKNKIINLLGLILAAAGITLTLIWYDYKLLVILFILIYANNIDQNSKA